MPREFIYLGGSQGKVIAGFVSHIQVNSECGHSFKIG